jgi:MFS family permease
LIGAGSIVGRLTTGIKSLSEEQVSGLSFVLQGISTILILFSRDFIVLALLSLAFGIGYGGYIPEFALLTRKYFGVKAYAAIFGLLLTSYSIGAFAGPLFEGYSLEVFGNFAVGFYVAGLASIIVGVHQILGQRANS